MTVVVFVLSVAGALCAFWPVRSLVISPARSLSAPATPSRPSSAQRWRRPVTVGLAAVAVAVVIGPVLGLVIAAGWPLAGWWRRRLAVGERERALARAQPIAIDLVGAVLGAGGTIPQALMVVGEHGPVVLRPAVERVMERRRAGLGFAAASVSFVDEAGPAYQPFVRALVATERDGAPVATLLERLAFEARAARVRELDVRAKRLPLLLLGPLALCSLPAVFVGSVIPLVIVAVGGLDVG